MGACLVEEVDAERLRLGTASARHLSWEDRIELAPAIREKVEDCLESQQLSAAENTARSVLQPKPLTGKAAAAASKSLASFYAVNRPP